MLHLGDEIFQKTNIGSLARVDLSPKSAFEGPVLVQDNGNLQISRADNQVDMTGNGLSQLFARVADGLNLSQNRLIQDIHPVVHDFIEQAVLAFDVVIQTGLSEVHRLGDVLHGCAVIALFIEHSSRNPAYLAKFVLRFRRLSHVRPCVAEGLL